MELPAQKSSFRDIPTDIDIQDMLRSHPKGAKALLEILKNEFLRFDKEYVKASDAVVLGELDPARAGMLRGKAEITKEYMQLIMLNRKI